MKHKKFYNILIICFVVSITNSETLKAQNKKSLGEISKYEIAIDLQNFFSDGIPDKVLFKINNIKEGETKGAYRLGIGASYRLSQTEVTQDDKNYELGDKTQLANLSLLVGYEKHNNYKNINFYYGADFKCGLSLKNVLPDSPGDSKNFEIGFIPFVGIEFIISKSISTSIEAGLQNKYWYYKQSVSNVNLDNKVKTKNYSSRIDIPYTFSLNFNF